MKLVRNHQALFALFLIVLDVAYFLQSLALPLPFQLGEPGPAFMPMVLSVVLFIAASRVLWTELAGTAPPDDTDGIHVTPRVIALIAATAAFIAMFEPLGYWIATSLYVFAAALLFEHERLGLRWRVLATSALISTGITAAGWLFFVTLFALYLPTGVL